MTLTGCPDSCATHSAAAIALARLRYVPMPELVKTVNITLGWLRTVSSPSVRDRSRSHVSRPHGDRPESIEAFEK
jgi:hypothetical protein